MKKILLVLFVVALLSACSLLNPDHTSQFFGTWSGSRSGSSGNATVTYTFNQNKTFSEITIDYIWGTTNLSGTWDADSQMLKLLYSDGFFSQCSYVFSTFNGKAELQLTYSTATDFLVKQ